MDPLVCLDGFFRYSDLSMTRHGDVAFVFERGPSDRDPCHLDNDSKQARRVCVVVATSETTAGLPYASSCCFLEP